MHDYKHNKEAYPNYFTVRGGIGILHIYTGDQSRATFIKLIISKVLRISSTCQC